MIVLLNGPAGVGKTSVAAHLASRLPGSVHIEGDALRSFTPSDVRKHLGAGSTYRAAATLAAAYERMGAPRVIFDYVFEVEEQLAYFLQAAPRHIPVFLVTLWASLATVQAREAQRIDRPRLDGRVEACYRSLVRNLAALGEIIPTDQLNPAAIAADIDERLRIGAVPQVRSVPPAA